MNFKTPFLAAVCAFGLSTTAQAASLDFVVDGTASSVVLTDQSGGGSLCSATNCGVEVALASGLDGTAFSLAEGDSSTFDFLRFEGDGTSGGLLFGFIPIPSDRDFEISATLAFSAPSGSATSTGNGGSFLLAGFITAGSLVWDNSPQTLTTANGSEFEVAFGGSDFQLLFDGDTGVTTSATVTASYIAPVPLPASSLLLIAGISGLAAMRRRKIAA